jgi:hypothetical protein
MSPSVGELGFIASITGSNPAVLTLNKRVGNLSDKDIVETIRSNFERWFETAILDPVEVELALSGFVPSFSHGIEASWRHLKLELHEAADTVAQGLAKIYDLPDLSWWEGNQEARMLAQVTFSSMLDRSFNPAAGEALGQLGSLWWSSPTGAPVTFPREGLRGSGEIKFLDDHWVPSPEEFLREIHIPMNRKIYRIHCVQDWVSLVEAYPQSVPVPASADWLGHESPVYIPNWSEVANHWDGIELSVRGWLQIAYVATKTPSSLTTHLAGWHPGSTVWLKSFK